MTSVQTAGNSGELPAVSTIQIDESDVNYPALTDGACGDVP